MTKELNQNQEFVIYKGIRTFAKKVMQIKLLYKHFTPAVKMALKTTLTIGWFDICLQSMNYSLVWFASKFNGIAHSSHDFCSMHRDLYVLYLIGFMVTFLEDYENEYPLCLLDELKRIWLMSNDLIWHIPTLNSWIHYAVNLDRGQPKPYWCLWNTKLHGICSQTQGQHTINI